METPYVSQSIVQSTLYFLKDPDIDTIHVSMSFVNNIAQLLLLLTAIVVFLVYWLGSDKYNFLRSMFAEKKASPLLCIKVIWRGRHTGISAVRYFSEIAIIRLGEAYPSAQLWRDIFQEYHELLNQPVADRVIKIRSVLALEGKTVTSLISEYFIGLKKITSSGESFLAKVAIQEGFIAAALPIPICEKKVEGWNKERQLRERRLHLAQDVTEEASGTTALDLLQIYLIFEWLIWKPSYDLPMQSKGYKRLTAYGLSDEGEANVLVIREGASTVSLRESLGSNQHSFGLAASITASIVDASSYIREHRTTFSIDSITLLNALHESGSLKSLLVYESHTMLPSQRFVYTAYLWLLLTKEGNGSLNMEESVCFWEHANLADPESCDFFTALLVQKSFAFFDRLFSMGSQHKYRFAFAVNSRVQTAFFKELEHRRNSSEYSEEYCSCIFDQPIYSFPDLIHAISHLSPTFDNITLVDVNLHSNNGVSLLCQFYAEIFMKEFPKEEQRESLENILNSLKQQNTEPDRLDTYHCVLAVNEGRVVGGAIFDYSSKAECGFLEYIVTCPRVRKRGVGSKLMAYASKQLKADAQKAGKKLKYILAETESAHMPSAVHMFFHRWQFCMLNFEYIQPSLAPGKTASNELALVVLPLTLEVNNNSMPANTLAEAIVEYVSIAMRRSAPHEDPAVGKMIEKLNAVGSVEYTPL